MRFGSLQALSSTFVAWAPRPGAAWRLPFWGLALALGAVTLLRTGIWLMPNMVVSHTLALSPYANPFPAYPDAQYLCWSYLGPYLGHLMGTVSFSSFFLLHLGFTLAASCGFAWLAGLRLPDAEARLALWLYASLPVAGSIYYWLGMDGLIHGLMILAVLRPKSMAWGLGAGLLLGMQHFESGLVGYSALAVAHFLATRLKAESPVDPRWLFGILAGLFLGRALLVVWFNYHDFEIGSGRTAWMLEHLEGMVLSVLKRPHLVLWGVFGGGWFMVAALCGAGAVRDRVALLVPLGGLLGLVFFVADTTRVMANVTFPLLLSSVLINERVLRRLRATWALPMARASLLIPLIFVVGGTASYSVIYHDFLWLQHALTGAPELPGRWWDWPWR